MEVKAFPSINMAATGKRIASLRREHGLSVRDLQDYFGFGAPQAIYKWQSGVALPSLDNLVALSRILGTPMESILVLDGEQNRQEPSGSVFLCRFSVYLFLSLFPGRCAILISSDRKTVLTS